MAFGQASGPPASRNQLAELLELLEQAGHADFKDARYPMGFTQRQAGGKFTSDEAAEFIETLQADESDSGESGSGEAGSGESGSGEPTPVVAPKKTSTAEKALGKFSDQQLAAELQHRGWIVAEP